MKTNSTFFNVTKPFLPLKILFILFLMIGSANVFGQTTTETITTTGSGTWKAPCGVTSITVEVWGAGGAGGKAEGNPSAGGGGSGGGFVKATYTVTPNANYNLFVGAGGNGNYPTPAATSGNGQASWFGTPSTILAAGGVGAGRVTSNNSYGGGATAPSILLNVVGGGAIQEISTKGGNGGNAKSTATTASGGGGSSAGDSNGNDANGITGGVAPANGFAGANGRNNNGVGATGNVGAGGAGGRTGNSTVRVGGNGGRGEIRITYTPILANYCSPTFYFDIEPITNVTFSGINNTTSPTINGTPEQEIFCDQATVTQGGSYPISLKGNTAGDFTNYFRVYIDWNQNGTYGDAGETYDIGTIRNSTGTDLQILSGVIDVPLTAATGLTRMRVIKNFNAYTTACASTGYGQAEDYVVQVNAIPSCSGMPTGGTAVLNPTSGTPNSIFSASVSGSTFAGGLTYQWESAPTPTGPWSNIAGATTASANITAINGVGTTYYRRKISCGSTSAWSTVVSYTTDYCTPSSTASNFYIKNVQFLGTLNPDTTNPSGYTAGGYANYKAKPEIAKQLVGEAINVQLSLQNTVANPYSSAKAWVDWNRDGIFNNDATEIVYDTGTVLVADALFGYIIPTGTAPGTYVIRIRNRYAAFNGNNFDPCETLANGETEDYTFEVINPCAAQITSVSAPSNCGAGPVTITAVGNSSTTSYKWFSSEFGAAISGANGSTYTTGSLTPGSYTYYVSAVGASCEAQFRTPVKVVVKPKPNVQFTQTAPEICGSGATIQIATSNVSEEVTLIDDHFDNLSNFVNSFGGNTEPTGAWQLYNGPHRFPNYGPAVSSGYGGGQFAAVTTDVQRNSNLLNYFSSTSNLPSTANFTSLKMDFDLYLYFEQQNNVDRGYFKVQYSINGGGAWNDIADPNALITTNKGVPTRWSKVSINLPAACLGQNQLRFRFVAFAYGYTDGSTGEWMGNLFAIDNLRIYGDRPLVPNFTWTGDTSILFQSDCTSAITSGTTSLCIKPSPTQIENDASWTVNLSSTLSNSCNATSTITIPNGSKTWSAAGNDWSVPADWKPTGSGLPDITKCVIIKTPVNIPVSNSGLAKNVTVQSGGKLEIAGNLTVTDFIENETGNADNFVVKSDGNLIQINPVTNTDPIRADRYVTDMDNVLATQMDYVYWSAPVTGQQLRGTAAEGGFSPGTPDNRFFEYNESTDYFVSTPDAVFTPGKGYAIRAEVDAVHPANAAGYTETYRFRGIPNNGDIPVNITRSLNTGAVVHGYNLVGNPYPSNISFDRLYAGNPELIYNTVWLWTNATYTLTQQGSGYAGNNYAVYNGSGGNNATTTVAIPAPNGIIKVGQGFLVQKRTLGTGQLLFKNSYGTGQDLRVTTAGTFYQKGAEIKNRFTLTLTSPAQLVNSQLIAYVNGATNGYEQDYDAEIMGMSSDLFYSVLGDRRLLIQGKGVFTDSDAVPLGANFFTDGQYTVTLNSAEGIFAGGQSVYLKDKQTGIITDLSAGSYSFTAAKGISDGRFEVIYKPETILSTDGTQKDDLTVYRDGDDFVIRSSVAKITGVELYDGAGRLLYHSRLNQTATRIDGAELNEGVYVLKIERGALVSSKKIMK